MVLVFLTFLLFFKLKESPLLRADTPSKLNNDTNKSDFILLKRPQFVLNIDMIRYLFTDPIIIGVKRDLIPNVYSMLRMRKENNYPKNVYIGLYVPGWQEFINKSPIEQIVWQYSMANKTLKSANIPIINYKEICDDTDIIIEILSGLLGIDLDVGNLKLKNKNKEYLTGTSLESWNNFTVRGELSPNVNPSIEFPPLKKIEIKRIEKYWNKYGYS